MSSAIFSKSIQVLADLTITNSNGNIQIGNDPDGNLVINFSDKQPFFALLNTQLPRRANLKTLLQVNQSLYQNKQPLVIKVKGSPWITLGKFSLPRVNYRRLAPSYISSNPSLRNGLYVTGAAIGATLLYTIFRRRN